MVVPGRAAETTSPVGRFPKAVSDGFGDPSYEHRCFRLALNGRLGWESRMYMNRGWLYFVVVLLPFFAGATSPGEEIREIVPVAVWSPSPTCPPHPRTLDNLIDGDLTSCCFLDDTPTGTDPKTLPPNAARRLPPVSSWIWGRFRRSAASALLRRNPGPTRWRKTSVFLPATIGKGR